MNTFSLASRVLLVVALCPCLPALAAGASGTLAVSLTILPTCQVPTDGNYTNQRCSPGTAYEVSRGREWIDADETHAALALLEPEHLGAVVARQRMLHGSAEVERITISY